MKIVVLAGGLSPERNVSLSTGTMVAEALAGIAAESPEARVLICGSLYLAGTILRENG